MWSNLLKSTKSGIVKAAGPLGLYAAAWRITRDRPRIFMYHRFAEDDVGHRLGRETFRTHLRMIRKRCSIVTMEQLADLLLTDPERTAGLAVITVDDGYRDFYDHAWPILQQEEVPATFFPVTGFVDGETWLWPDLVERALACTDRRSVTAASLGLPDDSREWSMVKLHENRAAWQALIDYAIDLPDGDKWDFLRALYERLELEWPMVIPADFAPVTWDQLRELNSNGIEIGAHTRTHCRLTRVDDVQLEDELAGARGRLETQLDRPVVSLCYPNGAAEDYDSRVVAAAQAAGYRSAVTAFFDGIQGASYELRRHGVGRDIYSFRKSLCGVDELSRRLSGAT